MTLSVLALPEFWELASQKGGKLARAGLYSLCSYS